MKGRHAVFSLQIRSVNFEKTKHRGHSPIDEWLSHQAKKVIEKADGQRVEKQVHSHHNHTMASIREKGCSRERVILI